VKKAFTLFEIMIVIILISTIYIFAINSFTKNNDLQKDEVTLLNLKKTLLSQEFEEKITIKCIENDFSCFVFIDGTLQEDVLKPIFKEQPIVYDYTPELEKLEFIDLELEQLQRYSIVFEYSCKKDQRCSEMIVETETKTYIFNDMYKKPEVIEYINDIDEYFDAKIREVKDAF
jgi:hypothetical protein